MTRTYRWARRAVWGTFAVVLALGCNPLSTIAFLTHKDTPNPAPYPLFPKDGSKKKEEVTVAVFVSQGSGQSFELGNSENVVASELAKRLPEMAKENKQKLVVVSPTQVNKFKYSNPNWKQMHPSAWGKQLGADYVLDIHLNKMNLYKPGSLNQLYEGRAEVEVLMYNVQAGGEPEDYIIPFEYPKGTFEDATSIPLGAFKKRFLDRLATEIAQRHIDYRPDSGIAEGH